MPTGPLHDRWTNRIENGEIVQSISDCRCMIGEDHETDGSVDAQSFYGIDDDDDDDDAGGESLSVHDAADIWMSNGMDEDYTFGYSDDELRRAAESS